MRRNLKLEHVLVKQSFTTVRPTPTGLEAKTDKGLTVRFTGDTNQALITQIPINNVYQEGTKLQFSFDNGQKAALTLAAATSSVFIRDNNANFLYSD
jgi:hypothetical protein